MHDPLTVAFEIRRPWPQPDQWYAEQATRTGTRWKLGGAFWVLAGYGLYFPGLITIWHRDPSGYDDDTCRGKRWRTHAHHWRIQIHPLQQLRRRILTRCAWCRGRSVKGDSVNVSHSWDRPRGHWWQGEPGLFHRDCSNIQNAHATCVCEQPVLLNESHGNCARCTRFRPYGITPERLARVRELSAIPPGARTNDAQEA